MFNFLKQKNIPTGEILVLKLSGLHCTSCALNIDGTLEDTLGVIESNTSYAKSTSTIIFDPKVITLEKIKQIITSTGYRVL